MTVHLLDINLKLRLASSTRSMDIDLILGASHLLDINFKIYDCFFRQVPRSSVGRAIDRVSGPFQGSNPRAGNLSVVFYLFDLLLHLFLDCFNYYFRPFFFFSSSWRANVFQKITIFLPELILVDGSTLVRYELKIMTHIQTGSLQLSGWSNIPRKRSQPEILAWGTCQFFFMNFCFLFSLVCLFFFFSLLVLPMICAGCLICCLLFMIRQYFLRVDDKLLLNKIIKIREL